VIARLRPRARVDATVLKGLAVLSVLGCVIGLVAVSIADWAMIQFHNELAATNRPRAADVLSGEMRTIALLNIALVVAVAINLAAVRLMLRGKRSP
jgi:hypothetical protein